MPFSRLVLQFGRRAIKDSRIFSLFIRLESSSLKSATIGGEKSLPTVAIIGAGVSGLAATKAAIECDLQPTVFERASSLGGLWRTDGGFTWDSLCTNLAADTCSFSDFPWPKDIPSHPHRSQVVDYLERYADMFELRDYVRFACAVRRVERDGDRKRWSVSWQSVTSSACGTEQFDFILVCSGFFSRPAYPSCVKNLVNARNIGKSSKNALPHILHSCEYKNPQCFRGQRVLVVGGAFSGADIAAEISSAGYVDRVVSSVGSRPCWYLSRCDSCGVPVDLVISSRSAQSARADLGLRTDKRRQRRLHAVLRSLCGGVNPGDIHPTLRVSDKDSPFLTVSSTYLEAVKQRQIVVRPSLVEVYGSVAVFSDGQREEVDVILCATGFHLDLPFFNHSVHQLLEFDPEDKLQPVLLHKQVFCPGLPNLALVGMHRSIRFASVELQTRWACLVFSKQVAMPTDEEMRLGIEEERALREVRPRPQFPDILRLIEELAELCGVHPLNCDSPVDGVLSDKQLEQWLLEGPILAAHFRLRGPHANPRVALTAIRTCNQRIAELQRKATT